MTPVALNRIQLALFEALGAVVTPAPVQWGYGEQPFDQLPGEFVSLQLIGGPSVGLRRIARGRVVLPLTLAVLSLPTVSAGVLLSIRLNGLIFRFETTSTDPTEARDGILDELTGVLAADGVTVSALGADALEFAPDTSPIWDLAPSPAFTVSSSLAANNAVEVVERTHRATVQVDCFSKGREPRNGAWALSSKALTAFESQDLVESMADLGVGVLNVGPVTDTSAVAGGFWETRTTFDVEVSTPANFTRPVDIIETVGASLALEQPPAFASLTVTAP